MGMKTTLLKVTLAVTALLGTAALADPWHQHGNQGCNAPHPAVAPAPQGRYEQRPVQRWVEGSWQQVYVAERCTVTNGRRHHGRGHGQWQRTTCSPARWDNRWVPGHYETVTETVWVPYVAPVQQPVIYAPPPPGDFFGVTATPAGVSFTVTTSR